MTYNFTLDTAQAYDVWYLGTPTEANYLSQMQWGLDSNAVTTASRIGDFYPEYDCLSLSLGWQKIAVEQTIDAGAHTLQLKFVPRADQLHYTRADAVAVIPSAWGWEPEETVPSQRTCAMLDAFQAYNHFADRYAAGVDENLDFDTAKIGSAGSVYTYTSKTPEVVTDTGIITRPGIGEPAAGGSVSITAQNADEVSDEFEWYLTVLPAGKYDVQDFKMAYTNGQDVGDGLIPGQTVQASASVRLTDPQEQGDAVVVLALYSPDGRLENMDIGALTATGEFQTVSAAVDLPDTELSGYTLKAFLWDGFTGLTPIKRCLRN